MARSSWPRGCVCWPSAGASITTPSGHTRRWGTDHPRRLHGYPSFSGAWKSGKQRTLPTFLHPRLLRRVISFIRRATLTIALVQNIGQATGSKRLCSRHCLPSARP
jgi:hypothetical protein